MKRSVLYLAIALASGTASAQGPNSASGFSSPHQQGQTQGQSQGQAQGQAQGQGQHQGQSSFNANHNSARASAYSGSNAQQAQGQIGIVANKGNSNDITIEDSGKLHYSGGYDVKNVPGMFLGGPASGPCNGFSGGVTLAIAGFGFGGNASTVDDGCADRETARMFHLLGDTSTGLRILKSSDSYKRMVAREQEAKQAQAEAVKQADAAGSRNASPVVVASTVPVYKSLGSGVSGAVEEESVAFVKYDATQSPAP